MNQRAQLEEFERKNIRAIFKITAFTICVQIVMALYGGVFLFALFSSEFTLGIFCSFLINFTIVMGIGAGCSSCRDKLNKDLHSKAKVDLQATICLEITYFCLYTSIAGFLYFFSNGGTYYLSLYLVLFVTPCLLLALVGFCVVRNFKILIMAFFEYQGANGFEQPQQGAQQPEYNAYRGDLPQNSLNNDSQGFDTGYAKAPEPFGQGNQAMAKDTGGMAYPSQ